MASHCVSDEGGGGCYVWPGFCGFGGSDDAQRAASRTDKKVVDNQFELRIDEAQTAFSTISKQPQMVGVPAIANEQPENTDTRPEYENYQDEYQVEVQQSVAGRNSIRRSIGAEENVMAGKGWHFIAPMDEDATLDRVPWCLYLLCGGCGCTRLPTHFMSTSKCCICVHRLETKECFNINGCCSSVQTCFCSSCLCQLPPRGGSPRCICCNLHACGQFATKKFENIGRSAGGGGTELAQQVYDHVMFETFVPFYTGCCGLGCGSCMDLYSGFSKCCSLEWRMNFTLPFGEEGCCAIHHACWCCHCQCRMPPKHAHNPILACCGWRLKKVKHHSTKAPEKAEAPTQHTMRVSQRESG